MAKWARLYGEDRAKELLGQKRAKQRAASQAFYEANRERVVGWVRRYQVERNPENFQKHQDKKMGRTGKADRPCPLFCEVCGDPPSARKKLFFDHCHAHGHFRGWLCSLCNSALGFAKDDPERLIRLAAYLEFDRIKRAK